MKRRGLFYNVDMPAPILATKLYIPPPRPRVVHRARLIERLNGGLAAGRRLTLISAPAVHSGPWTPFSAARNMMQPLKYDIRLSGAEKQALRQLKHDGQTERRLADRARIILWTVD